MTVCPSAVQKCLRFDDITPGLPTTLVLNPRLRGPPVVSFASAGGGVNLDAPSMKSPSVILPFGLVKEEDPPFNFGY